LEEVEMKETVREWSVYEMSSAENRSGFQAMMSPLREPRTGE
jgi:hypothetical protein